MNATLEAPTAIGKPHQPCWRVAGGVPPPPQDRVIKIVANIVDHDEWSTSVESYAGYARWDESAQDWLNEARLSIRGFYEAEFVILEWAEYCNPERRFVLKNRWRGEDDVQRLMPLHPRLALPAPAWMSDFSHPHNRALRNLTDAELERRADLMSQFIGYLLGGRHGRRHLWDDHYEGGKLIERELNEQMASRWLRARSRRRIQSQHRRSMKKVRAA